MPGLTAKVIGSKGSMGKHHVAAYKECGVRLVDIRPDIVSIASPDNTHGDYVVDALKSGAHVFCEKPLVTNRQQLERVASLGGDKCIWQNFPLRYQPIFVDLKEKLPDYGEIYRIEASYNWGRTNKLFESWRTRDYSLVMGGMIHVIDLVVWLLGMEIEPKMVAGTNMSAPGFDGPDTVSALCMLDNGGICNFTVDGGTGVKSHNHRITVHGTKGGITLVNHLPTDKKAAIRDFVKHVEDGYVTNMGLYSTVIALTIEEGCKKMNKEGPWS